MELCRIQDLRASLQYCHSLNKGMAPSGTEWMTYVSRMLWTHIRCKVKIECTFPLSVISFKKEKFHCFLALVSRVIFSVFNFSVMSVYDITELLKQWFLADKQCYIAFLCHPDAYLIGWCHVSEDTCMSKSCKSVEQEPPLSAGRHQLPAFTVMGGSVFQSCKHRLYLHLLSYSWKFRLLKLQCLGEDPVIKGCCKWPSPPSALGAGVPPAWPLEPSPVCPDKWESPSQASWCGCWFPVCVDNQQQSWMCIPGTHTDMHKGCGWLHRLPQERCCLQQYLHTGLT